MSSTYPNNQPTDHPRTPILDISTIETVVDFASRIGLLNTRNRTQGLLSEKNVPRRFNDRPGTGQ